VSVKIVHAAGNDLQAAIRVGREGSEGHDGHTRFDGVSRLSFSR